MNLFPSVAAMRSRYSLFRILHTLGLISLESKTRAMAKVDMQITLEREMRIRMMTGQYSVASSA